MFGSALAWPIQTPRILSKFLILCIAALSDRSAHGWNTPPTCRAAWTRGAPPALEMSDGRDGSGLRGSSCDSGRNLLVSSMNDIGPTGRYDLILASQSPRRREILDLMGLGGRYSHTPSPLDESALQRELAALPHIQPEEYTRILAERKAKALGDELSEGGGAHRVEGAASTAMTTLILGSDTIVDLDGDILEKPLDEDDAIRMITSLSGRWHRVHTGVAIFRLNRSDRDGLQLVLVSSFTETARVKFATLANSDIKAYVRTGEPMDKAGSYGIQGVGGQLVEQIDGDFFTVMGLPMHRLSREMSRALNEDEP